MKELKLSQTENGKAYEYACLLAIYDVVKGVRPVEITKNSSLIVALAAWNTRSASVQELMRKSAVAGIESILPLEPMILEEGTDLLELSLQADNKGQTGDVRDIVMTRRNVNWEIGISVKHNHEAVKNSRLSPTIDFGKDWLGMNCSQDYFAEIMPVFESLEEYIANGDSWRSVEDKNNRVYAPLLNAFKKELLRLDAASSGDVPGKLLMYLLGRNDFYKLIADEKRDCTVVQCYNIFNTLNSPAGSKKSSLRAKSVPLPSRIHSLDYRRGKKGTSATTLELVMDSGWSITFRIHNASTLVEKSLKFEIQLTGIPPSMYTNTVSW